MPWSAAASSALRTSTSQTASWNDAATSATGTGSPERSRASTQRATAVLRPENEKSKRCRSRSRREVSPRGKSMATLLPDRASRSMCGPPGNGSPSSRATLSNASPAASSMVAPSGVDAGGDVLDPQQAGVAAADQHRQARLRQRAVLELVDGDVRGEVVDAVERLAEPDRQRLGRRDADEQRAGQARSAGDRDRVDVVRARCRPSRRPARSSAPSPRGAPGWRPRARRRRTGRARRRCSRPRRPAGCGRGRCRRRSRRRRSRCRGPAARHGSRDRSSPQPRPSERRITTRRGAVPVVARPPVDLDEPAGGVERQRAGVVLAHLEQHPVGPVRRPARRPPRAARRRRRYAARPARPRSAAARRCRRPGW